MSAIVLCILFLAAALPVIACQYENVRAGRDQNLFHLPTAHTFAAQWPHPDFSSYLSATTPGYHLALAMVERLFGDGERGLRLSGALFTLGLLATYGFFVGSRAGPLVGIAVGLPLVASLYVFTSGAWALPDNAGWWGVVAILLIGMRPRMGAPTFVAAGVVLLALVLVRQAHLWCAAILWLAACWGPDATDANPSSDRRTRRIIVMMMATLPAFAALAWFVHLWHGLTPPLFSGGKAVVASSDAFPVGHHRGINLAMPSLVFALTGLFTVFYAAPLLRAVRRISPRRVLAFTSVGALLGAAAGLLPHTDLSTAAGRFSGLWNLTPYFPVLAGRSLLIALLSTVGGIALMLWYACLRPRDAAIGLAAWTLFTVAHTANAAAWQRYVEPFVLIWLGLLVVRLPAEEPSGDEVVDSVSSRRGLLIGQALLAALLATITCAAIRRPANRPSATQLDGPATHLSPRQG